MKRTFSLFCGVLLLSSQVFAVRTLTEDIVRIPSWGALANFLSLKLTVEDVNFLKNRLRQLHVSDSQPLPLSAKNGELFFKNKKTPLRLVGKEIHFDGKIFRYDQRKSFERNTKDFESLLNTHTQFNLFPAAWADGLDTLTLATALAGIGLTMLVTSEINPAGIPVGSAFLVASGIAFIIGTLQGNNAGGTAKKFTCTSHGYNVETTDGSIVKVEMKGGKAQISQVSKKGFTADMTESLKDQLDYWSSTLTETCQKNPGYLTALNSALAEKQASNARSEGGVAK